MSPRFSKPLTGTDRRRACAVRLLQRGDHPVVVCKLSGLPLHVVEQLERALATAEAHARERYGVHSDA